MIGPVRVGRRRSWNSLAPLLDGRTTGGFIGKLAYSEEVLHKKARDEPHLFRSVFAGRWHVLDSMFAPLRLYDLECDSSEENPMRLTRRQSRRFRAFLDDRQRAELEIRRGIT